MPWDFRDSKRNIIIIGTMKSGSLYIRFHLATWFSTREYMWLQHLRRDHSRYYYYFHNDAKKNRTGPGSFRFQSKRGWSSKFCRILGQTSASSPDVECRTRTPKTCKLLSLRYHQSRRRRRFPIRLCERLPLGPPSASNRRPSAPECQQLGKKQSYDKKTTNILFVL